MIITEDFAAAILDGINTLIVEDDREVTPETQFEYIESELEFYQEVPARSKLDKNVEATLEVLHGQLFNTILTPPALRGN